MTKYYYLSAVVVIINEPIFVEKLFIKIEKHDLENIYYIFKKFLYETHKKYGPKAFFTNAKYIEICKQHYEEFK